MFGFISKKKLKKEMLRLKEENDLQDFKARNQSNAQYWQGYEDGNDNVLNYILHKFCKQKGQVNYGNFSSNYTYYLYHINSNNMFSKQKGEVKHGNTEQFTEIKRKSAVGHHGIFDRGCSKKSD